MDELIDWAGQHGIPVALAAVVLAAVGAFFARPIGELGNKLFFTWLPGRKARLRPVDKEPSVPFQGRVEELAQVEAALADRRVCVVHGMPGIGKTALAEAVGRRLRPRFDREMVTVRLGACSADEAMRQAVKELDPACLAEGEALAAHFRAVLGNRRILLLLDDVADEAQVEALLPPPPSAAIITSRHAIGLPGVADFLLPPLPAAEARAMLRCFLAEDSRATDDGLDAVAEACGRVPLALRLSGSLLLRQRDLPLASYVRQLKERRGEAVDAVMAALTLTWEALAARRPDLAAAWPLLSVCPGEFDAAMAAAVCAHDDGAALLSGLAAWSLVHPTLVRTAGGPPRPFYRLLDLPRSLAAAKAGDGAEVARERHAVFVAEAVKTADNRFQAGEAVAALATFDALRGDWEAAFAWAAGAMAGNTATAPLLCRLGLDCENLLALRLRPPEHLTVLASVRPAASQAGNRGVEMRCCHQIGNARFHAGEARAALAEYERALALARDLGNSDAEAATLENMATCWSSLGEDESVAEYRTRALALYRAAGNRYAEAVALTNLGISYWKQGKLDRAQDYASQALSLARNHHYLDLEQLPLAVLADLQARRGNPGAALETTGRALAIARTLQDRWRECQALGNLGVYWINAGNTEQAIKHLSAALALARDLGERNLAAGTLTNLARLFHPSQPDQAVAMAQEALALYEALESPDAAEIRAQLAEWAAT